MSEYQYYEFLAIDEPLNRRAQSEVRTYSTRATITATSFMNEYHWGDFRGDPWKFLEKYFDVMVYVADWGTRRLAMSLPVSSVDVAGLRNFEADDCVIVATRGQKVIVDLIATNEDYDWDMTAAPQSCMASLATLRTELQLGDMRGMYLAWLRAVTQFAVGDDDVSPPTPAGLHDLTAAQEALVEFLDIDDDLLTVARQNSGRLVAAPTTTDWLRRVSAAEKDRLLLAVYEGRAAAVRAELMQHVRRHSPAPADTSRIEVAELISQAAAIQREREQVEAERAARAQAKRRAEAEAIYDARLHDLASHETRAWNEVEAWIEKKNNQSYDQAVAQIIDLAEVARRQRTQARFNDRLAQLHGKHFRKGNLIAKLTRAGITVPDA